MTVLDTPTETAATSQAAVAMPGGTPAPRRRRGRRPLGDADGTLRLEAQTIKAYRLGDDARRTAGYLRRILNQRHIPDEARVAIDGDRITIEWADA
jgi:hypothetical protein